MENKIFDWRRFGNVINHDIRNMWPTFGPTLLIIVLLPLLIWLGALVFGDITTITIPTSIRLTVIALVISLAGIMAPSRLYRTANLPKKGIYFAMLPASKFEKYLSMLLMVMVVVPIAAICGSLVLDTLLSALPFGPYRDFLWASAPVWDWMSGNSYEDFEFYEIFFAKFTPMASIGGLVLSYINGTALFLFTSTLFKKHKVLYTILWLYLIEFVLTLIATPIIITKMLANDAMWITNYFDKFDPEQFVVAVYWIGNGIEFFFAALFIWWAGYRLRRMHY
ncbi:MAG: hypothetical protein K5650_03080 [Bacteroidales bacterium]|nr:hypothetical protein [Bacteroidales bacterium]